MELPRGARRCENADIIGGKQPYLQHLFSGKQECFAGKVGTEKWWRRLRASQPSSRIRHFEHGAVKPLRRIAPSPVSSFRAKARNLFRSRQDKGCEDSGERETPCSLRIGRTVFHASRSMQKNEGKKHLKQAIRQRKSPALRRSLFIGSIVPEPR